MVNSQLIVDLVEKFFENTSMMSRGDYKDILVEAGEEGDKDE